MWSITWYNCQLLSHYSMSVFSKREDFELTCKSLMIKVLGFCSISKQFINTFWLSSNKSGNFIIYLYKQSNFLVVWMSCYIDSLEYIHFILQFNFNLHFLIAPKLDLVNMH